MSLGELPTGVKVFAALVGLYIVVAILVQSGRNADYGRACEREGLRPWDGRYDDCVAYMARQDRRNWR